MQMDAKFLKDLENHIKMECDLYQEYIDHLESHKESITKFNLEQILVLNKSRKKLIAAIEHANQVRLGFTQQFPNSEGKRLTELIMSHLQGTPLKRLLFHATRLKALAVKIQRDDFEFNHILVFALNTVNGSLSILWQATQDISKSYNIGAKVKESFCPKKSRSENTLRKA